MQQFSSVLDSIRQQLGSAHQSDRVGAMQHLLRLVRQTPEVRAAALPIFQSAVENEGDPHTAIYAARGVAIAGGGPEEVVWSTLLNRPEPKFVAVAISAMADYPGLIRALADLWDRRPELPVRRAIVRLFSRSNNPAAYNLVLRGLDAADLRADAVEALGNLGNPAAIDRLTPLLEDRSDAWAEDIHGPMLRVCDLAATAIEKLSGPPTTPPPVLSPMPINTVIAARPRLSLYIPLSAAIFSVPWFAVVIFWELFTTGKLKEEASSHGQLVICMIPAAIGILVGSIDLAARRVRRTVDRILIGLGWILCAAILAIFLFDLSR